MDVFEHMPPARLMQESEKKTRKDRNREKRRRDVVDAAEEQVGARSSRRVCRRLVGAYCWPVGLKLPPLCPPPLCSVSSSRSGSSCPACRSCSRSWRRRRRLRRRRACGARCAGAGRGHYWAASSTRTASQTNPFLNPLPLLHPCCSWTGRNGRPGSRPSSASTASSRCRCRC